MALNFFKIELDFATIGAEPKYFFPVELESASASVYEKEKNANDLFEIEQKLHNEYSKKRYLDDWVSIFETLNIQLPFN